MVNTKRGRAPAVPSLIKWTGSKRSQAHRIAEEIPPHKRYFEPFLGGGALLYLQAHPGAVAGDIYGPLIGLWKIIQMEPGCVVEHYEQQWNALQDNLPGHYYLVRDRFNRSPNPMDLNFLVRTCVNGIIRFNRTGKFNNSFHLSRKGMRPERFARIVMTWHDVIQGVEFVCCDYAEVLSETKRGDFVYLDPPYAGNNLRYTDNLDLNRFFEQLEVLNLRDVKWALSFDGWRGRHDLSKPIPRSIYKRRLLLPSGYSAIGKVLNGPIEPVYESLYLSF